MISAAFFRSSSSIRSRSAFSFFRRSSSSCAFRAASSNETPDETLAAPSPFFAPSLLAPSPPTLVAPSLLPVPVGVVVPEPEPEAARMLALLVVRGTAGVGVIVRVPMTGGGTGVEGFDTCGVTGFEVADGLSQLEKKSSASADAPPLGVGDARAEGSVEAVPSTYIRWGNLFPMGDQKLGWLKRENVGEGDVVG